MRKPGITWIWLVVSVCLVAAGLEAGEKAAPATREMNFLNWKEFRALVPAAVETVLLPVGSIEPHGVIPSGTDNLAPEMMAREIAERVDALIAPTLNYGVTPSMAAYPGAVSVSAEAYGPFIQDVLTGLGRNGFRNIIVLNGHGGNTDLLQRAAAEVSPACRVRILVVNWWSLTEEEVMEVFGEQGGHAGNNETAYIQAAYPAYVHPELYDRDMAIPNPKGGSWFAVPVPASILLYEEGQGYPTFDEDQAAAYFRKVNDKVAALIQDVIRKWDHAGLYR